MCTFFLANSRYLCHHVQGSILRQFFMLSVKFGFLHIEGFFFHGRVDMLFRRAQSRTISQQEFYVHVTLRSGAKKYVEFTHNEIQLHSADGTDRIVSGKHCVRDAEGRSALVLAYKPLYILSSDTRSSAPPRISRWSRLFELRSLLGGAMTRTLTRIDGTHPHICGNYIRSRISRSVSFRSNTDTHISRSCGIVMRENRAS